MARSAHELPPHQAQGWAKGLIHFHTRFSDGWATIRRAAEIARKRGYDFLIVTDHIQDLKLKRRRTLDEYLEECEEATQRVGIPVIPGGELEVDWNNPVIKDFSEAHTIAFTIRNLVTAQAFDWQTPGTAPFAHWRDSEGRQGTILSLQETLLAQGIPPAASHQFQHSPISLTPGAYSDYRYDIGRLEKARFLDFFYSGAVDLIHEPEDIELVADFAREQGLPKAVYASCDYHVGPDVWPAPADFLESLPTLRRAYAWAFRRFASLLLRFRKDDPEIAAFPYFAEEQLTHATYVYLGDQARSEDAILEAIRHGRTCVSRGFLVFEDLSPAPGFDAITATQIAITLNIPASYSAPRPRSVILIRDGRVIRWEPYAIESRGIVFNHLEVVPPGTHTYQVYVPSKFLSSPIIVRRDMETSPSRHVHVSQGQQ
jgi:hypothetical protein